MTTLLDRHPLDSLIKASISQLDITAAEFGLAVTRYEHLGNWLLAEGVGELLVYPQGSFRLGTVVRPEVSGQFDIDLVFLRDLKRSSVTQLELKTEAGELLARYLKTHGDDIGNPTLEEKGRCWCLTWAGLSLHMDILPVIPDDTGVENGVLLTDRDLHKWQYSNPIGYADWFWDVMRDLVATERAITAALMHRDIEDVPVWLVRTPLQRAVQVIKRHRDLHFAENSEMQPSSILLTTLAGRAYRGEMSVERAISNIASSMHEYIEVRDGKAWVENPAHAMENFADKWETNPERRIAFNSWLATLISDVEQLTTTSGMKAVTASLSHALGDEPVRKAVADLAIDLRDRVEAKTVGVTAAGTLSAAAGTVSVPRHDFYGEPRPR